MTKNKELLALFRTPVHCLLAEQLLKFELKDIIADIATCENGDIYSSKLYDAASAVYNLKKSKEIDAKLASYLEFVTIPNLIIESEMVLLKMICYLNHKTQFWNEL